jgi:hypothetical protein
MVRKSTSAMRRSSITWASSMRASPKPTMRPDLVKIDGLRRFTVSSRRSDW